jgi:hypothetical protein
LALHFFLVQVHVSWSSDLFFFLQAGTHPPSHFTWPVGHDSHAAVAVTSPWRDRRRPARCAVTPTGQASTHCPLSHVSSASQQVPPQRGAPPGQASTHTSLFSQLCPSLQQRLPHFFSVGQSTQNPPTHA